MNSMAEEILSIENENKKFEQVYPTQLIITHWNCSMFLNGTYNLNNNNTNYLYNLTNENCIVNQDEQHNIEHGSFWIRLMVLLLYGIVCIVGICGNSLVIYVVLRFSKMQTVTNLYIVNLAIADECFLVGIPFLMTTTALEYWPFGDIMCKIYFTTTSINQVTSSMFLLIMSADRFLAVCHPISATKWRTSLIASMVAITAWAISAFVMVPIFMYANTREIRGTINCNIFWPNGWIKGDVTFMMYSFILGFAIPLTLISIFYFQVIIRLKHVGPKRHSLIPPSMESTTTIASTLNSTINTTTVTTNQLNRARDRKKSHRKVTKLVLTVITVYFLCWAPYWISQLALISMEHETYHSPALLTIFLLAGCLSYSNSAMNPILYAFLSDNFKKSFVKACSCTNQMDVNAALAIENSIFRKNKNGRSERRGTGDSGTRSLYCKEKSNTSSRLLGNHSSQYLNESSKMVVNEAIDEEDGVGIGLLESDDGTAILGTRSSVVVIQGQDLISRSVISSDMTCSQDTYRHGVHVTSL